MEELATQSIRLQQGVQRQHTNIEQNRAVLLLVDDMRIEDLVV